jgi:hypothetical protein
LPVEGQAGEGDDHVQLIVFAPNGWLKSLELVYYCESPPTALPDPSRWQLLATRSC